MVINDQKKQLELFQGLTQIIKFLKFLGISKILAIYIVYHLTKWLLRKILPIYISKTPLVLVPLNEKCHEKVSKLLHQIVSLVPPL